MITGYLAANAGTAKVCGMDVSNSAIAVKKRIGYLPEANPLYYDMYVKEYLHFVAGVYKIKFAKAKIKQAIELTGLSAEQHKKLRSYLKVISNAQALPPRSFTTLMCLF